MTALRRRANSLSPSGNFGISMSSTHSFKLGSSLDVGIDGLFVSSLEGRAHYKPRPADFEPIKVLGRGAFGKVLLVREIATGRLFAQKQLKKATMIVENKNVERTMNEKSILEAVRHPNIVKLYYAFQDNHKVYLILEYVEGGELFSHLAQERILSETKAAFYVAEMVLGLHHLHQNVGVVYRDLKPENCLLDRDGHLVLTDFGLSKVSEDDKCTTLTGTPQYMAPEILQGKPYDYAVDWWSLGCVCFDLLTGSPPFTGNNHKRIMEKILKDKVKFPFYLSADAKDLLIRLLRKEPSKRLGDNNIETIKNHRFFRKIDWKLLEAHDPSLEPPILPIITDPILAENFDREFTDMAISPVAQGFLEGREDNPLHLNGFSYTNESYLESRCK
ncbi:hypothetical protein BABINDRAFT_170410 [Babjeviella inositovora NRRL Y-12698]|uniref:Protein kinase domain-containing protein n=1 Tax=Babjeviella inositovora NRRL Y-12698 TaxID=984486 RepID=A0A1E3QVP9_9ASCO|nr:uncharacterized protein BABINDRAFT_170410 [Babjeviella inositovora NRRL Y-12698]ODQ81731.1 hypothetical protein BABINDRAFT_170410 [Babjeviella inositovora NRRL Y-12698]